MSKKKKEQEEVAKDNVKEFKKKEEGTSKLLDVINKSKELKEAAKPPEGQSDPREGMSPEEIKEYMKKEEEQLYGKLDKFLSLNPKPDTSSLTEEDEEEETFTLDLEKKMVTQKLGEGVVMRDEDGTIHEVKDPKIKEAVKEAVAEVVEVKEPSVAEQVQKKYQDMITDRFVSKAIASIIERMNEVQKESEKSAHDAGLGYIAERLGNDLFTVIQNQKLELRAAIAGGKVHYDKIPEWAKGYIDDHVQNALNSLIDFVERD